MEKIKRNKLMTGVICVTVIVLIVIASIVIKKLTPNKEVMDLTEYYQVDSDKVLVILQNQVVEEQGFTSNPMGPQWFRQGF